MQWHLQAAVSNLLSVYTFVCLLKVCLFVKHYSLQTVSVDLILVMLRAWRERDQEKRIKTAHQALEHNPKYVMFEKLFCYHYLSVS